MEVLIHTLYCNWGRKYRSLYRGSTVRQRKKNRPHPSPQVSCIILSCRGLVLPCFSRFYVYWQFNSSPTIISGDRTKWFSINSLLFWKIAGVIVQGGGRGVHLPIIKCPVHHSIHSPLFSQNFPLAIERDSAHAGSTIKDCILSYKSDFILRNSTLHVPFYDQFQSN